MTNNKHRGAKTSVKDIINFCVSQQRKGNKLYFECGLAVDWIDAHERCWRCGYKSRLQKCHIIPHSRGGKDSPDNLVLLCRQCHRDAPDVTEPTAMWRWLRSEAEPFYDTFWGKRAMETFEKVHSRKIFDGFEEQAMDLMKTDKRGKYGMFGEILKKEIDKAVVHFGEGRLSTSTICFIFEAVEKRLKEHINGGKESS